MAAPTNVVSLLERDTGWYQTQPDGVEERTIEVGMQIPYAAGVLQAPSGWCRSNTVFATESNFTVVARNVKSLNTVAGVSNALVVNSSGNASSNANVWGALGANDTTIVTSLNGLTSGFTIDLFPPPTIGAGFTTSVYMFVTIVLRRPAYT